MSQHAPRALWAAACALLAALAAPRQSAAQLALAAAPAPAHRISRPAARAPRLSFDTLVFAHAALRDERIDVVPALERMGTASHDPIVARPMLVGAAAELRTVRARSSVLQLLERTASSLEAICTDAQGPRRRACRALSIDLTAARAHLRAGRKPEARRALASLARRSDDAVREHALEQWEGTVIGETARYALDRT